MIMEPECSQVVLSSNNPLQKELYFLIAKFLSGGPCQRASQTLIEDLESNEIIPKSVNWLGEGINQDYKTFSSKFNHINPDHLPKLLDQLIKTVNTNELSSTVSSRSLLSFSTLSLLEKSSNSPKKSSGLSWSKKHGQSIHLKPFRFRRNISHPVQAIAERSLSGYSVGHNLIKPEFYKRMNISCNTLGHLSAVYCVLFDVTGKYIFTGADDHLVKIWSAVDGRLLATLRGTSSEVTDLAVNQENTLIAVASCDKLIRIWCLRTCASVAVLSAHSGNVTSIFFCPIPRSRSAIRYLASTSTDGSCAFWAYSDEPGEQIQFQLKPTMYLERMRPGSAQMICSSFSSGGIFMAAGSADNHVRVYYMLGPDGPERILEVEHHSDRVDSISWAHEGLKFVSGSKDGTALIWRFENSCWRYTRLHCSKNPGGLPAIIFEDSKRRPRVTMVGWNADDSLVLTAVSDHIIKVWDARNGELVRILKDHTDEAYVIEAHPFNPRTICTAGHDGKLIIWDIGTVEKDDKDKSIGKVYQYYNQLGEGQGFGALYDCKWSPDGFSLAVTDSHGHLMIFTIEANEGSKFKKLPGELFFHTDYRPLIRDAITHEILDEQTQVPPHLMPPPFLVDVDGNPYPAILQRLVPGRENVKDEFLIPNVAVGASGYQEVIEGIPVRSNIDEMIHQLAIEQGLARNAGNQQLADRERRGVGLRRSGEVEGVRQSRGDWQTGHYGFARRHVVPSLSPGTLSCLEEYRLSCVEAEEMLYHEQLTKGSPSNNSHYIAHASGSPAVVSPDGRLRRMRKQALNAAERRIQQLNNVEELLQLEGVARPNPRPQMEISVSQESPRRPLARRPNPNINTNRRPRQIRYGIRQILRNHGESDIENVEIEEDSSEEAEVSTSESSSSEDSDSDWGGTLGTSRTREDIQRKAAVAAEGRKRSKRLHSNSSGSPERDEDEEDTKKEPESNEDNNEDDEEPGPSSTTMIVKTEPVKQTRPRKARKKAVDYSGGLEEIPELYQPSEWLAEVFAKRSPYFPQLGDDLIYYRQGHEFYINEVEKKKMYTIPMKLKKLLPYVVMPDLEPEVPVRVVGIKFELEPPRLVALKLARTDLETRELTGTHFYVKYHDVANVVDFLILRQMYERSKGRRWNDGDRFRCLISREWWLGTIDSHSLFSEDYPNSNYLCYKINWDNGDPERMSPWDMDIIPDDFEIPANVPGNNGIPASQEDMRIGMYEVSQSDWPPHGHQEAQCQKISNLLEQVMGLAISEAFLTPVDLNLYPDYAQLIEYPIDLATIKARLDNLFYRRVDALKYDVKYIAMNAEKFNQLDSDIVRHSRVIRDVCLEIITNPDTTDVNTVYHTILKNYSKKEPSGQKNRLSTKEEPGTSSSKSKVSSKKSSGKMHLRRSTKSKEMSDESENEESSWEKQCMDLLSELWQKKDAAPFRQPVDITRYSDYLTTIDTPMDLQIVREELKGGNYESPLEFHKDMQMIFSNSRTYNTDSRSSVYSMTIRLQSLYEAQIKKILSRHKGRRVRDNKRLASPSKRYVSRLHGSKSRFVPTRAASSANSTPRKNPKRSAAIKNPYLHNEEESSDDGESEHNFDNGNTGHNLRTRTNSRRSNNKRVLRENGKSGLGNGHDSYNNNPNTNGYTSSSPRRQSSRIVGGARQVKRRRISSDQSTRSSPKRGIGSANRLSNTSSHGSGSTPPNGPSSSRVALKRHKIPIKNEPDSDEFEDSEEASMPSSSNSTPRKNPKRSAAIKNPYLHNEEESSDDGESEHNFDNGNTGHNLRTRTNSRRSNNKRELRENENVRSRLRNGHDSYNNSNTNGYTSSSPRRQSSRIVSGARQVKRRRISSGESHPSTRSSPKRGVGSANRLSNTSSHGSRSTPPNGPSSSRAALKRHKIPIKNEPDSDEFEDSEETSMPTLNKVNPKDEEYNVSEYASDSEYEDHENAASLRRSCRVQNKRTPVRGRWDERYRIETRNKGKHVRSYAEAHDGTEDEDD